MKTARLSLKNDGYVSQLVGGSFEVKKFITLDLKSASFQEVVEMYWFSKFTEEMLKEAGLVLTAQKIKDCRNVLFTKIEKIVTDENPETYGEILMKMVLEGAL